MATFGTFVDGTTLKASELNGLLEWTTFTPVVRQSASLSVGTNSARYARVNKLILVYCWLSPVNTGTANTRIEVDMPITAAANNARVIGTGFIFDSSANDHVRMAVTQLSTTRFAFISDTTTSLSTYIGQTGGPEIPLASGDTLCFVARYEAA